MPLDSAFRRALAICPVLQPAAAVTKLDRGWIAYQRYFLGKWRRAFAAKQAAFPRRLSLVGTLTDYFVARHTPYRDADEYYGHDTLGTDLLGRLRIPTRMLATDDDPVVPIEHARALAAAPGGGDVVSIVARGGHCGFIEDLSLRSALDGYVVTYLGSDAGAVHGDSVLEVRARPG
jgi:uncharacterized protein